MSKKNLKFFSVENWVFQDEMNMCKLLSILNNVVKREEGFMDYFGKINLINYIVKFIYSINGCIKLFV